MNGVIEIILVVAIIGYLIVHRLTGQPVHGKRLLLLPAMYVVLGVAQSVEACSNLTAIGFLAITAAVSLVMGLVRGARDCVAAWPGRRSR